jgi:streptogramin lyase
MGDNMNRFHSCLRSLGVFAVVLCGALPAIGAALPNTGLMGTVKSSQGKLLEGVPVSAKAQGSTITTSVYTNRSGEYYFPPLPAGQYHLWTQAVGFEFTDAERAISPSKKIQQDFTLKPSTASWKQLSDAEWFASLPEGTAADKKMKRVLLYNCGTCHSSGFVLEKRFNKADWGLIVNHMLKIVGSADPQDGPAGGGKFAKPMLDDQGTAIGSGRRVVEFYKNDIIAYLARVRGPEAMPLKPNPFPRATGESAAIVVTEYDVPSKDSRTLGRLDSETGLTTQFRLNNDGTTARNDAPTYHNNEFRDGSDWSRGLRADSQEEGQHDLIFGKDGYVYLPPSTGVGLDQQANIWYGDAMAVKFDIKAEKLTSFSLPKGWPTFYNGKDVDAKGNFWAAEPTGVYRLNPKTGEYREFKSRTPVSRPYGVTVDSEDSVWFAELAINKVGYVDGGTGEVGEVSLPPIDDEEIDPTDKEVGWGWAANQPLYSKGPRRLRADMKGDTLWVCEFFAGRLAKIDIHTKKLTEYKLPGSYRYAYLYEPVVDKNHIVWFSLANADAFGKFDPATEKFTFYPLPTRGTNVRHIDVDNTKPIPEIWLPYDSVGKVARIQFRANAEH